MRHGEPFPSPRSARQDTPQGYVPDGILTAEPHEHAVVVSEIRVGDGRLREKVDAYQIGVVAHFRVAHQAPITQFPRPGIAEAFVEDITNVEVQDDYGVGLEQWGGEVEEFLIAFEFSTIPGFSTIPCLEARIRSGGAL